MASLKLFGALFIVLFAVATATTYTTTVTTITTTEDEGSSSQQGSSKQCSQEIQSKDFNMCEMFLSPDQQQGGGRLRMIVQKEQEQGQREMQKQCCQELKQVESMCRCAAIEDVVKQQMKGRQSMESQEMKKVMDMARDLPRDCNFDQPRECKFDQPKLYA